MKIMVGDLRTPGNTGDLERDTVARRVLYVSGMSMYASTMTAEQMAAKFPAGTRVRRTNTNKWDGGWEYGTVATGTPKVMKWEGMGRVDRANPTGCLIAEPHMGIRWNYEGEGISYYVVGEFSKAPKSAPAKPVDA